MNKYNYLHQLNQLLAPLDEHERHQIMRQVEDRFKDVLPDDIEHIVQELGRPLDYATPILESRNLSLPDAQLPLRKDTVGDDRRQHYIPPSPTNAYPPYNPDYKKGRSFLSGFLLALLLLFFNLIIVLAPAIAIISLDLGLLIAGISSFISGIVLVISGLTGLGLSVISLPTVMLAHPTLYYAGAGLFIGLGGLLSILIITVTRLLAIIAIKYVQWNIHVIRGYV